MYNTKTASIGVSGNSSNFPSTYYDIECIKACCSIRYYARKGKLILKYNEHESNAGANVHLFKLIEECGIALKQFIIGYLSVIQPYSLKRYQVNSKDRKEKNLDKHDIWMCDIGYSVQLLIKIDDHNNNKVMIVSFHESNIAGRMIKGGKDFYDKPCAIIADSATKMNEYENNWDIEFTVQRGFVRDTIKVNSEYCYETTLFKEDFKIALIEYKAIEAEFSGILDLTFNDMLDRCLDSKNDAMKNIEINRPISINEMSFMSIGYTCVNNIYMLLDLYANYRGNDARRIIATVAGNLIEEIPPKKRKRIKEALKAKFEIDYDKNKKGNKNENNATSNKYNNGLYSLIMKDML